MVDGRVEIRDGEQVVERPWPRPSSGVRQELFAPRAVVHVAVVDAHQLIDADVVPATQ